MEQTRENDSFIDDLEMSSSCAPANVATVVIRPDDGRIAGLITSAPAAKAFSFQFKPQSVAQFKALDRYPHYMHATMAPSLTLAPSDIQYVLQLNNARFRLLWLQRTRWQINTLICYS